MSNDAKSTVPVNFPIATVAFYGPDDQTVTKVVVCVFENRESKGNMKRWVKSGVLTDAAIEREIIDFVATQGVLSIARHTVVMGCQHEERVDFPAGGDCPVCAFWKGKQGRGTRMLRRPWHVVVQLPLDRKQILGSDFVSPGSIN